MKFKILVFLTTFIISNLALAYPAIYNPQNSYRNISDGTTVLTANGEDTLTFTSTDGSVAITASATLETVNFRLDPNGAAFNNFFLVDGSREVTGDSTFQQRLSLGATLSLTNILTTDATQNYVLGVIGDEVWLTPNAGSGGGAATASYISDIDGDTLVETEKNTDEDIVRITADSVEVVTLASESVTSNVTFSTTNVVLDSNEVNFDPSGGLGVSEIGHIMIWDGSKFINSNTLLPLAAYAGMSENQHVGDIVVDSGSVYYEIERTGGGDVDFFLTVGASNTGLARFRLDCTTGSGTGGKARVLLTEGTATNPQLNYIYVTELTPPTTFTGVGVAQLVASTTPPTGAFAWIGRVSIADDTFTTSDGAYTHQRYDDTVIRETRGAFSHHREKTRSLGATWLAGINPTLDIDVLATPDTGTIATTSGTVSQMHPQMFPSFADPSDFYVPNDFFTPYEKLNDIYDIDTDVTGATLRGRRYNLVLWGSVDGPTGDHKLFINVPTGSYGNNNDAINDRDNKSVYTVPTEFSQTAFLIARFAIRHLNSGGGQLQLLFQEDLRGVPVGTKAGGATGGGTEFSDDTFRVLDDGDITKELAFEVSGVTSGNTREITIPDYDGIMAVLNQPQTFTDDITIDGSVQLNGIPTESVTPSTVLYLDGGELKLGNNGGGGGSVTDTGTLAGVNGISIIGVGDELLQDATVSLTATIGQLTDVNIGTPSANDVMQYVGGEWTAQAPAATTTGTLGGVSPITILDGGDALLKDATVSVTSGDLVAGAGISVTDGVDKLLSSDATITLDATIGELSNVLIDVAGANEFLQYNGTNWVSVDATPGAVARQDFYHASAGSTLLTNTTGAGIRFNLSNFTFTSSACLTVTNTSTVSLWTATDDGYASFTITGYSSSSDHRYLLYKNGSVYRQGHQHPSNNRNNSFASGLIPVQTGDTFYIWTGFSLAAGSTIYVNVHGQKNN